MAFAMPAWSRNKRVKYIGPDGAQVPEEDRRWHWLQAHLTQKLAQVAHSFMPYRHGTMPLQMCSASLCNHEHRPIENPSQSHSVSLSRCTILLSAALSSIL